MLPVRLCCQHLIHVVWGFLKWPYLPYPSTFTLTLNLPLKNNSNILMVVVGGRSCASGRSTRIVVGGRSCAGGRSTRIVVGGRSCAGGRSTRMIDRKTCADVQQIHKHTSADTPTVKSAVACSSKFNHLPYRYVSSASNFEYSICER